MATVDTQLEISVLLYVDSSLSPYNSSWQSQSLIGAVIGCIAGGPCSDYVVIFITKRRSGYFQPEFRLWTLFPAFVFAPIGLIIWGVGLRNHLHPMVAIAGTGITYGVLCAVPSIAMTYVVDCYRPLAGETMTILTAFKNVFAFGLSFAVIPWILKDGFVKVRSTLNGDSNTE